ncbi:hypothetical protein GOB93_11750 [Acetobacter musti]|uniref:Uncharacterized protein n=1 Tax=Acetobacter musti TaxID=864732 RepID=A0ABX0JTV1_9PROT|nr:glycosyltransferase family 1 protein [Acetobacter musti]NHN85312.1 hypothetical protein [Acetobacter musti]
MSQKQSVRINPVGALSDVSSIFEIRNHGLSQKEGNKSTIRTVSRSARDEEIIRNSGLFDEEFYYNTYPDVKIAQLDAVKHYISHGAAEGRCPNADFDTGIYMEIFRREISPGENPFSHYIRTDGKTFYSSRGMLENYSHASVHKAVSRMEKLALFNADDYIAMNSDITTSNVCPTRHAVIYGISEGRSVLSGKHLAKTMGRLAQKPAVLPDIPLEASVKKRDLPYTIGVLHHSSGNVFIRDIAKALVDQLNQAGLNALLMDETYPVDKKPQLCIFCGPHEFFFLPGSDDWKKDEIIRRSIMFNTEQPQTQWFVRGLIYNLMGSGIIDISFQNMELFSDAGIEGLFFSPPVDVAVRKLSPEDQTHSLVRVLPLSCRKEANPKLPFSKRLIDVSFFGNHTEKREKFFARHAEFFSDYKCFFYYRRMDGPIAEGKMYGILSRLAGYVASHSKISLNIHRGNEQFFEWHRIVAQGMACGSVVVSEECLPHPLFTAGTHYLTESTRHIPNLVEWLLRSADGKKEAARIRSNAFSRIMNGQQAAENQKRLLQFISSQWKIISHDR